MLSLALVSDARAAPERAELLAHIARRLYGTTGVAEWIPSHEADVFRFSFEGLAPRIVKIDRGDDWVVRREQLAFPALRARGFVEFPEVEFTQADLPGVAVDFMVMPETSSRPLADLWHQDHALAIWTVSRTGDFLRRLATVPWQDIPGVASPAQQCHGFGAWFENWFRPLTIDPATRDASAEPISLVMNAMRREPAGFGGWQFAQVVTDGCATFTAIDWTNIGAYWPLNDLASTIAALSDYGDDAPAVLRPILLNAYTNGHGLNDEESHELGMWQAKWRLFSGAGALRDGDRSTADQCVQAARRLLN